MANTDVTVTLAGKFFSLTPKECKVVLAAMMFGGNLGADIDPTTANWKAAIQSTDTIFKGIPNEHVKLAVRTAGWYQVLINSGHGAVLGNASSTASQLINVGSYITALPEEELDRLIVFLEAQYNGVLT